MVKSASLLETHPDLCAQWDYNRNNTRPEEYTKSSKAEVWWICPIISCEFGCAHKWKNTIRNRTDLRKNASCPFPKCTKYVRQFCIHQSLLYTHTNLCKEWNYEKNKLGPENYSSGSHDRIEWICGKKCDNCNESHKWSTEIRKRTESDKTGCPWCSSNCVKPHCFKKSLAFHNPDLCEEWDIDNELEPSNYLPQSNDMVWWICNKENKCGCIHKWKASINKRNGSKRGCPYCANHKWCSHKTLLFTNIEKYKHLWKEWYVEENILEQKYITNTPLFSGKKIWWKCLKNEKHIWKAAIQSRTSKNTGCPFCTRKTECMIYDWLITLYSKVEKEKLFEWTRTNTKNGYRKFDFIIEELKLIIELDGDQHFRQVHNWESPEIRQKIDIQKMEKALDHGYRIIRIYQIDVYYDIIDWKTAILNAINESEKVICVSEDKNLYDWVPKY